MVMTIKEHIVDLPNGKTEVTAERDNIKVTVKRSDRKQAINDARSALNHFQKGLYPDIPLLSD